jgi:hypothetical protein
MSMYCFGDGKVEDDWGVETFLADRYALALVGGNEMVMTSRKRVGTLHSDDDPRLANHDTLAKNLRHSRANFRKVPFQCQAKYPKALESLSRRFGEGRGPDRASLLRSRRVGHFYWASWSEP